MLILHGQSVMIIIFVRVSPQNVFFKCFRSHPKDFIENETVYFIF